jgi:hypothetical protein
MAAAEDAIDNTIGLTEKVWDVETVVHLDANGGTCVVMQKEVVKSAFTNTLSTKTLDPAARDWFEAREIRKLGGHVCRSTSVEHPRVSEGGSADENAVICCGRRHSNHEPAPDVGVNCLALNTGGRTGGIQEGIRAEGIKRIAHGDNTNLGSWRSANTTVEKHPLTKAIRVRATKMKIHVGRKLWEAKEEVTMKELSHAP